MNVLIYLWTLIMIQPAMKIFDFNNESDLSDWMVVDDVVMGGRSEGNFSIDDNGHGVFYGDVSLENYGGFSSIRYQFEPKIVAKYKHCVIRLKGDGKRYQFRTKSNIYERHAYIYYFETTGDWQTIKIPLHEMYPTFRGRRIDIPNYPAEQLEQIAFLIANKKAEAFELKIDWIGLE